MSTISVSLRAINDMGHLTIICKNKNDIPKDLQIQRLIGECWQWLPEIKTLHVYHTFSNPQDAKKWTAARFYSSPVAEVSKTLNFQNYVVHVTIDLSDCQSDVIAPPVLVTVSKSGFTMPSDDAELEKTVQKFCSAFRDRFFVQDSVTAPAWSGSINSASERYLLKEVYFRMNFTDPIRHVRFVYED